MASSIKQTELEQALASARGVFAVVGGFSLFINLLMLVSPIYMLQVYDRVLTSRSEDTLIMLTVLAVGLLAINAVLELARSKLLVRLGGRLDARLNDRVFAARFDHALAGGVGAHGQPLRDLEQLRAFLTGPGLVALFDVPWTPLFIALIFLFHPVLGAVALIGAVLLFAIALGSELATRGPQQRAATHAIQAHDFADAAVRNAEAIRAMGMLPGLRHRWLARHQAALAHQATAADRAAGLNAGAKFIRPGLQIAVLGLGAYLVILEQITPGVMIATSIIMGRALAPVEATINHWRSFIGARGAHGRLDELLGRHGAPAERMPLPPPEGRLRLEGVTALPPGARAPVLHGISFELARGELLGVIGPSAAGKSTLARMLVGVWPPTSGHVRLDGAELRDWSPAELGRHIGYLPQDVELFDGTVHENIARFGAPDPEGVVAAARTAGAHEMILALSDGYDTRIGEAGSVLSGGQRQRIGLARALYGAPALIVLDEPNANLDGEGEEALRTSLGSLKALGRTVVVISHRPNILATVDTLLMLRDGRIELFGPQKDALPKLMRTVRGPGAAAANMEVSHVGST